MSNPLAIAAVTAALRDVLSRVAQAPPNEAQPDAELADTTVSTRPLDKARATEQRNQLNLFLYQATPHAAFRNQGTPGRARPGETAAPPLALNLYYLLTAYGRGNDDVLGHRLLGRAMSLLHDHTVLGPTELEVALAGNDLHLQAERVRINPYTLSLEEMSKLWTISQTQYRLSVAYEVSVVLIDSTRPVKAPLPVLSRGGLEHGQGVQPGRVPPFSALAFLELPLRQPAARLGVEQLPGDTITATGTQLGEVIGLQFSHRLLEAPLGLTPLPGQTETHVRVQLPSEQGTWPAGPYTLAAVVRRSGKPDAVTGSLPFSLAPRILSLTRSSLPEADPSTPAPRWQLTVRCSPQVWPRQRVSLLLNDLELPAQPHPEKTDTLTFPLPAVPPGEYWARLRVDGVDSLLVDYAATPLAFDAAQKVALP